jgi:hypothetical protein
LGNPCQVLRQIVFAAGINESLFFTLPKGRLIHVTIVDVTSAYTVSFALFDNLGAQKGDLSGYTKIIDNESEGANVNVIWSGNIPVFNGQGLGVTFNPCVVADRIDVSVIVELTE